MIALIVGYIYLALHRPMEIWPILEPYRIELVYFALLCATWIIARKRIAIDLPQLAIATMGLAVGLAWIASPWSEQGAIVVKNYTLVVVFALMLATVLRDEQMIRKVVAAFLAVMALYMLHSLREYILGRHTFRMGISRLIGVDRSLGDPNSFGASIVYSLPFVRYLWLSWPNGWQRKALIFYVLLAVACVGLTGSRSAFVSLILWGMLTVWITGRHRVPLVAFALVGGVVGFALLPAELQNRFTTIVNPAVGPENARESGQGRIEGFFIGCDLWAKYPITGVGPGAWLPASGRTIESHNLYGQLLGELGTVGVAAFGLMIFALHRSIKKLLRLIRDNDPDPRAEPMFHLAQAIAVATLLLLFEGLFGHNLYRYNFVWGCAFLSVALRSYRQQLNNQFAEEDAAGWNAAWA